jgi:hypothetical protein
MKVRTDLKTGNLLNDLSRQSQQAVSTAAGYLMDTRKDVLNFGQNTINQARQALASLIKL